MCYGGRFTSSPRADGRLYRTLCDGRNHPSGVSPVSQVGTERSQVREGWCRLSPATGRHTLETQTRPVEKEVRNSCKKPRSRSWVRTEINPHATLDTSTQSLRPDRILYLLPAKSRTHCPVHWGPSGKRERPVQTGRQVVLFVRRHTSLHLVLPSGSLTPFPTVKVLPSSVRLKLWGGVVCVRGPRRLHLSPVWCSTGFEL